jgi:hypothetical protein
MLEVDAWELLEYVPYIEPFFEAPAFPRSPTIDELSAMSPKPMSANVPGTGDQFLVHFDNDCLYHADLYKWSTTGTPEFIVEWTVHLQSGDDADIFVQEGDVFSVMYTISNGPTPPDDCDCRVTTWNNVELNVNTPTNLYTVPGAEVGRFFETHDICEAMPPHTGVLGYHFDAWLTPGGRANICENKWS